MAWVLKGSKDRPCYMLAEHKVYFLEDGTLTLDEMNHPDRDIDVSHNPRYIKDYREYDGADALDLLPSGLYKLECSSMHNPFRMVPWGASTSTKLFKLDVVEEILKDFANFQSQEELYAELQMAYKRGILLYGPPGTGKTSAIKMMLESISLDDVLIVYVESALPTDLLRELKRDKRLKMFIFEELTQTLKDSGMNRFLTFMDGENSLEKCYVVATTNYPEELPGNIVDRPGRFDKLFEVKDISKKDKKVYLEFYLKRTITKEELDAMKAFSMAYLKELILKIRKDDLTVVQAISALNKHKKIVKDSFMPEDAPKIGFSGGGGSFGGDDDDD